jgi:Holliday junction DNA helicase RuvA
MITYLEGTLLKKGDDRVVVFTTGVGYEVLLPPTVRQTFRGAEAGEDGETVKLHISYQQSERQPKPILIGFSHEVERDFFEMLITVKDIGPAAAVRALTAPVPQIARAIEQRDAKALTRLDGIGQRKAETIIATLCGKVGRFALMRQEEAPPGADVEDFRSETEDVLVKQLGYKRTEAQEMIDQAFQRRPEVASAEELFEEILRGQMGQGT